MTQEERRLGRSPAATYAHRYARMAEALLRAYPCGSCRRHFFERDDTLLHFKTEVAALPDDAAAGTVVDALAIAAARLHHAVTAGLAPSLRTEADAELLQAADRGDVARSDLARLLHARWEPR